MKTRTFAAAAAALSLLLIAPLASAEDYEIRPATSRVSFTSDAPFETIVGTTASVEGSITVSPADPTKGAKATVNVDMASIKTGVDLRDEHFRSEMWLDTGKFPKATFELERIEVPAGAKIEYDKKTQGTAHGKLTIKGKTQTVKVPVTVGMFKPNPKLAQMGLNGDVLRVKTSFDITLRDYGVAAPENLAGLKVANTVNIAMDITALKK